MTKKKIIPIIVVLVLIIGLVGAMIYLNQNPAKPTDPDVTSDLPDITETVYILGNEESPVAKKVKVENELGTYTAVAKGEDITIEGLEEFQLNGAGGVLSAASRLTALETVDEEGSRKADFGLDKPAATVSIEYEDNSKATLYIGATAPGDNGMYVYTDKGNTIYIANNYVLDSFLKSDLDFVDKVVTPGSLEETVMKSITLSGSVRKEPIVIESLSEDDVSSIQGIVLTSHVISAPISIGLDTRRGNEMLQSIFGIAAERVVAVAGDTAVFEEYGLKEPYSTAIVKAEDSMGATIEFTVHTSEPTADGTVYIMKEGVNLVYQTNAKSLPWISVDTFDIMSRMIYMPFINEIEKITMETPEKTTTFDFDLKVTKAASPDKQDEEELTVTVDGNILDTKNFRAYYQTLISTSYDSEITSDDASVEESSEVDSAKTEGSEVLEEGSEVSEASSESSEDVSGESSLQEESSEVAESSTEQLEVEEVDIAALGAPLLTIAYYINGEQNKLVFYEGASRKAIIQFNNEKPRYVQSSQLDKILEDLELVVKNETVVPAI